MQTAHRCRVRGYLAQGTRPQINLFQVRYTSEVLASSGALLGRELRVYYNSDDLRTVRAFLSDGSELGILKAQGAWGEISHDLKLRREIMKLRAKKRLAFTITQEFIDRFVEENGGRRSTAGALPATWKEQCARWPTVNTPPAPLRSVPMTPTAAPLAATDSALPAQTPQKIEPQKLTIPSGFTTVI
jgi:putative transposase